MSMVIMNININQLKIGKIQNYPVNLINLRLNLQNVIINFLPQPSIATSAHAYNLKFICTASAYNVSDNGGKMLTLRISTIRKCQLPNPLNTFYIYNTSQITDMSSYLHGLSSNVHLKY